MWASDTVEEVLATSSVLSGAGVLRIATLQDQSTRALVQPEHASALAVGCWSLLWGRAICSGRSLLSCRLTHAAALQQAARSQTE